MKKIITFVSVASFILSFTTSAIAQMSDQKRSAQKLSKEDSIKKSKEFDKMFEDAASDIETFIIDPQKKGDSLNKVMSAVLNSNYSNAINHLKDLDPSKESRKTICDALLDCKKQSDYVEPMLKGLSNLNESNKAFPLANIRYDYKDTFDYKKMDALANFYKTTFLPNKEFIYSAINKNGCNNKETNKTGVSDNTPTYAELNESLRSSIGKISSRQQELDREQKEKTDAMETKAETQFKIAGTKNGYYEAYANDYFGYNVWYVATIEKNIDDKNKANTVYNDWKNLLTQCLKDVHFKEQKSTDGNAFLAFESAYYKEYGNAHFKLTLRMIKDKGLYTVNFIVE